MTCERCPALQGEPDCPNHILPALVYTLYNDTDAAAIRNLLRRQPTAPLLALQLEETRHAPRSV